MGNFIDLVDGLAKQVEEEKIKAIGARNHLKSIAKEREAQKQQLKALIAEKKMQLERYVVLDVLIRFNYSSHPPPTIPLVTMVTKMISGGVLSLLL